MRTSELIILSIGLSMDAFAVSISNGLCYGTKNKRPAFYSALAFGFFQGLMPIIGFFVGGIFSDTIQRFDHWIAFGLLAFIGVKMIYEAVAEGDGELKCERFFSAKLLFLQAIATSIDALAVGISFALIAVNIWTASAIIAVTTFGISLVGALGISLVRTFFGQKFGSKLGKNAEIFGGVLLFLIGLKILVEHLWL